MALGLLTNAAQVVPFWLAETCISHHCQVIIEQAKLDHSVSGLHSKIQGVYELLLEEDTEAMDIYGQ